MRNDDSVCVCERSRFEAEYLENRQRLDIDVRFEGQPIGNSLCRIEWSPMTSRDPEMSRL